MLPKICQTLHYRLILFIAVFRLIFNYTFHIYTYSTLWGLWFFFNNIIPYFILLHDFSGFGNDLGISKTRYMEFILASVRFRDISILNFKFEIVAYNIYTYFNVMYLPRKNRILWLNSCPIIDPNVPYFNDLKKIFMHTTYCVRIYYN